MGLDNVLRGRKRYLDGGNCAVSVFENQASASSGSPVLDIDEIEWEEGYGDRTDEEGEGKAAVFLIAFVLFTFANGFGGSIISGYFWACIRWTRAEGLLEIPRSCRELWECFVIAALSGWNLTRR